MKTLLTESEAEAYLVKAILEKWQIVGINPAGVLPPDKDGIKRHLYDKAEIDNWLSRLEG